MSEISIVVLSLSGMAVISWVAWLVYRDAQNDKYLKPKK